MDLNQLKSQIIDIPQRPGIYIFKNAQDQVIYVGKALSLKDRLQDYLDKNKDAKTNAMVNEAVSVSCTELGSDFYAILHEARLIKEFQPKYNVSLKDDKSFIYVFISIKEDLPKISVIRRPKISVKDKAIYKNLKGEYFGPFPSANTLRRLLKTIRRVFPYCQQTKNTKPCFYSQLGLCRPCPGYIIRQEPGVYQELKHNYRLNIFRIIKLFNGNSQNLRSDLEKEMKKHIKDLGFESAQATKNQLQFLENLASYTVADEMLKDANQITQNMRAQVDDLASSLKPYFLSPLSISKIEAYDISNFQGDYAVGSQIVFRDGLPEKSLYRRYKIKTVRGINDVAMMNEVLSRRFKHPEWPYPDLILVDGGKAQLAAGLKILTAYNLHIPMIGLAKRFERVLVKQPEIFVEAKITPAALIMLKRIRDEAHRFALAYHRHRFKLLTENA